MVGAEVDVQAQTILVGLQALSDLLGQPVARDALDLSKNARTNDQYDKLLRLQRSLTQYLERNGDLFYVGLLGHFSSGKSSTINSLLKSWQTPSERETGLNPTDKTITLITNTKNENSLLGIIREGHVTIRHQTVDSPFLENIVIADTPGTGDPHLIEEIARDFLPICDVILFLFSAASPLDQTDIPLLAELHKRLPFIPLRFVVTRADELRDDFNKKISEKNLSATKRARFFTDMLPRLNTLLKPSVYTEEHFILIDNKAYYNLVALRELLRVKCDPSNPTSRILMHGHKLRYYLTSAKELRDYFALFLSDKLHNLNKIVETANKNINRYNEHVRISSGHLISNWHTQHQAVSNARAGTLTAMQYPSPVPSVVPRTYVHTVELSAEARRVTAAFVAKARSEINYRIQEHIREMERRSESIRFEDLSPGAYRIQLVSAELDADRALTVPMRKLGQLWVEKRNSERGVLLNATDDLKKVIQNTKIWLQARSPVAQCEKAVAEAQEVLTTDLHQFFRHVELYRDGVFSHTTKEAISTLGIGAELDALESEFTSADKDGFSNETLLTLFPDFSGISAKSQTIIVSIDSRLRPLIDEVERLVVPKPEQNAQLIESLAELEIKKLRGWMMRELQRDVDTFTDKLSIALSSRLVAVRALYDAEIAIARRRIRSRYIGFGAFAGAITLLVYLGYRYLIQSVSATIFETVLWSVSANIIGDLIGYVFARLKYKFPEAASRVRERFETTLRANVRDIAEKTMVLEKFESLDEENISKYVEHAYLKIAAYDPDGWHNKKSEYLVSFSKIQKSFEDIRGNYSTVIEYATVKTSDFFRDAEKNLEVLNSVASKIKERAIEPSFVLLNKTRQKLDDVRGQIQAVEFS